MLLSVEDIQRIQQILLEKGFIQDVADGVWNPHKISGYRAYLETQPLQFRNNFEIPYNVGMLTPELQEYLSFPDLISIPEGESEEDEIDSLVDPETGEDLAEVPLLDDPLDVEESVVEDVPTLEDVVSETEEKSTNKKSSKSFSLN